MLLSGSGNPATGRHWPKLEDPEQELEENLLKLRPEMSSLPSSAERYDYVIEYDLFELKPGIDSRGFLTKADLQAVADWKSPRSAGHIAKNSPKFVKEITRFTLSAHEERSRIEVLRLLHGVEWPMASVILHFYHSMPYPILDYRALYTVGMDVPNQYSFALWWQYVEFCRALAKRSGLDMRELDKAL